MQILPQTFEEQLREIIHLSRRMLAVARWEGIDGPEVRNLAEVLKRSEELAGIDAAGVSSCGADADPHPHPAQESRSALRPTAVRPTRRLRRRFRNARSFVRLNASPLEPA